MQSSNHYSEELVLPTLEMKMLKGENETKTMT